VGSRERPPVAPALARGAAVVSPRAKAKVARKARKPARRRALDPDPARARDVLQRLRKEFPEAKCALEHETPHQLLVATILSAQCTDEMVNKVTPELFRRYPTAEALAKARRPDVEKLVKSTGFFRNKAKNITGMAKTVVSDFEGRVPQTMDELLTLPGVARKTANVVLGVAFGKAEGVVVDTHVHRLTRRLGLTKEEDPKKIERDLMELLPREDWIDIGHLLIWHGRRVCGARKPLCEQCVLRDRCPSSTA
jgi:endonuclease-3